MSRIINSVQRSPIRSRVHETGQGERLGGVMSSKLTGVAIEIQGT
ncbi:hypothetical protein [Chamaesiphon sp.]